MFVWLFHRVSGLILIVLLGIQIVTGMLQLGKGNPGLVEAARGLHANGFLMTLLVFLIIMHAMYGLRTVLYDVGIKRERVLFWGCTALGIVLTGVYLWFFFGLT